MSRQSVRVRGIALTSFLVAGSIALAGCTPPLPPDVLAARAENQITCQTGDQPVTLPEEFTGAMLGVSANLQGVCPEQTISELLPGEAAKVEVTSAAPTAEQLAAFQETCPTTPIVVPAFAYPVSLAYNIIGLEGMIFTPEVIAQILNGTITSWEDPAIAEANPGIDLTGLPEIAILGLDAPSGAVSAMTSWLAAEAPEAWLAGAVDVLPTTTATFPTTTDLMAELTLNEGGVAVFQAVNNAVPVGTLPVQDLVIGPDDSGLAKVGAGATTLTVDEATGNITATPAIGGVPVEGNFDLAASKVVLAEGQPLIGWPVMGMAHLMVCDDGTDPLPLSTAQYILRLAGQGGLETFGLTPLPEPIRIKTFTPLKVVVNPDATGSATPSGEAPASSAPAEPAPVASAPAE